MWGDKKSNHTFSTSRSGFQSRRHLHPDVGYGNPTYEGAVTRTYLKVISNRNDMQEIVWIQTCSQLVRSNSAYCLFGLDRKMLSRGACPP
jgi:hypothetical protein